MPPVEKKRRSSKRFAEWEEKPVTDFDPENEVPDDDANSDSEESVDENAGTEHYVAVGKSKLRKQEAATLGPEYRGARVSRAALEESSDEDDGEEGGDLDESGEEEFADPDTADLDADHIDDDAEISSDDALAESDDEKLKGFVFRGSKKPLAPPPSRVKKRATAADWMGSDSDQSGAGGEVAGEEEEDVEGEEGESISGSDEDGLSGSEEGDSMEDSEDESVSRDGAHLFDDEAEEDSDDDEEGDDDDDDDEDDEEEEEEDKDDEEDGDDEQAELRKLMEGQKNIASTMSQKAQEDAAKGQAIRQQRRTFDAILNLRIRLQKALIATNTFSEMDTAEASTEPYQAAEEAAVKLWNTIDSVRHTFLPEGKTKAGMKRKRIDVESSNDDIWRSMEEIEKAAMAHRRKVLDKWSNKVRDSSAAVSTRRLVDNKFQTLLSVLDDQMMNKDKLVSKVRVPRSCAPAQAAKKVAEDQDIYDDADFYQLLLKELVDQRSVDTEAGGQGVATVRWAALKEAKTRKQVDRKASKGRKLRFTVHEKLQNFMAPEDRRSWEEHAVDRFFGTLFGQKMELKEDDNASDTEMGGVDVEEDGLRLFRS
ncbi:apoptosis-antagonizing transcription factor [Podospora conica]|nr:apoptosis-antagonizing transcription factor [Schizothecium conicum]